MSERTAASRAPYEAPSLEEFGTVHEVTQYHRKPGSKSDIPNGTTQDRGHGGFDSQ